MRSEPPDDTITSDDRFRSAPPLMAPPMKDRPSPRLPLRQSIWHHLTRAPHDRHHPWRTPVLATTTPDGEPNARTVVLLAANATQQTLTAFTDHRSAKAFELAHHPKALFVFLSERLKWQLRVRALVTVQTSGPEVDAVWQRVQQSASAGDYLTPTAPGTPLVQRDDGTAPLVGQHHLSILTAQVLEIDWLKLSAPGHRRARIGPESREWLTP